MYCCGDKGLVSAMQILNICLCTWFSTECLCVLSLDLLLQGSHLCTRCDIMAASMHRANRAASSDLCQECKQFCPSANHAQTYALLASSGSMACAAEARRSGTPASSRVLLPNVQTALGQQELSSLCPTKAAPASAIGA